MATVIEMCVSVFPIKFREHQKNFSFLQLALVFF